MYSDLWIEEKHSDYLGNRYKVEKVLFSGQSQFQKVDVVETKGHGKMLLNDGLVMVTERDEFIYHDMIAHVPLFVHPNPQKVLVIGGGDGGTAREVLRHPKVKKCVMVEIDEMVVNACKEHIPQTSSVFSHQLLDLKIEDGLKFVKETKEKFDVILVDSTDPIGPAQPLFGPEFYQDISNCLTDNGIVVSQCESPHYEETMQTKLVSILNEIFPICTLYSYHNLTYPGGHWCFSFASKGLHPIHDFDKKRVIESNLEFEYYNEDIHVGAFALPSFLKKRLSNLLKY
ncbi:MAG: polyamine aminopropyltransferase [Bacteriovoracaceae bacterium]